MIAAGASQRDVRAAADLLDRAVKLSGSITDIRTKSNQAIRHRSLPPQKNPAKEFRKARLEPTGTPSLQARRRARRMREDRKKWRKKIAAGELDPTVPCRRMHQSRNPCAECYDRKKGGDLRTTTKAADSRSDQSPPPNVIYHIHESKTPMRIMHYSHSCSTSRKLKKPGNSNGMHLWRNKRYSFEQLLSQPVRGGMIAKLCHFLRHKGINELSNFKLTRVTLCRVERECQATYGRVFQFV